MLSELVVDNLVIVAAARLAPERGLTVLSGETGAGKSLILDALALVTGARSQTALIGPAGDAATVTAVFTLDAEHAGAAEAACGVAAADGQLILRRRLSASGRSQAWINDVPVTVAALKGAAAALIGIHAQHEALRLHDPARQLELIDAFGGHLAAAEAYAAAHRRVLDLARSLAALDGTGREGLKELDYLRFQLQEFTAFDPAAGEVAELERRATVLSRAGELQALAAEAVDRLGESDGAAIQRLAALARRLAEAPDQDLAEAGAACRQALDAAQEAVRLCAGAADRLHADPREAAKVQERLDAWYLLMRKHGDGEAAVLAARERIAERVAELENLDGRRSEIAAALAAADADRRSAGGELAKARRKAFARLAEAVHGHLADLAMPKARLTLAEEALGEPGPHGTVRQELLVATNPGLAPGRLADIASGGEASRLTLALAVALADQDRTPVLVFDEIDSGVGGRLGAAIGAKLGELGRSRTVIAVTHTPQLAARGDRHYAVRKEQGEKRTVASVAELSGPARVAELSEMLGGGAAARAQAEALIADRPGPPEKPARRSRAESRR